MSISDAILSAVMEKLGIEQEDIDKSKEMLDMITFTKEDGKEIILIEVGENIEVKIKR
tara:strand:- start:27 stop:200 length:174 start_codon:yes stop_codon:yes gene_type:complete